MPIFEDYDRKQREEEWQIKQYGDTLENIGKQRQRIFASMMKSRFGIDVGDKSSYSERGVDFYLSCTGVGVVYGELIAKHHEENRPVKAYNKESLKDIHRD